MKPPTKFALMRANRLKAIQPIAPSHVLDHLLDRDVKTLDLIVRTENCLYSGNVYTIRQLLNHTEASLLATPNMSRKSVGEIQERLEANGYPKLPTHPF